MGSRASAGYCRTSVPKSGEEASTRVLGPQVCRFLFGQEEGEALHRTLAHSAGHGLLHSTLLDAHVDDAGHQVGQRQVGIGLDKKQEDDGKNEKPVGFQVFQKSAHRFGSQGRRAAGRKVAGRRPQIAGSQGAVFVLISLFFKTPLRGALFQGLQ